METPANISHKGLIRMFTVRVDYGHHDSRDFEVKDAPGRTRRERAAALCRITGGLRWEVY